MSAFTLEFHRGGVYLPKLGLWLDPHDPQPAGTVFVSHAHSDHIARHGEIVVSPATSQLMRARLGGEWIEHVLPFGQPWKLPGQSACQLTLLPAGHIFGSAMAWIEAGPETLLYTGDFKLRSGLSAEKCEPRTADILIMETTFGQPKYQFPPAEEVIRGVIRFCREALDNDETPVLLGYSLGKSQEMLCGLGEAGLPIALHETVHKLTKIYESFGRCFPPYEKLDAATARGKVLLCPPASARTPAMRGLGRTRTAILTGWAVDPNCRFRHQAHAAFPLSDHADFPDLLEFVKQVRPKKVFTLHGFAAEFAQTLRDLGIDAQALSQNDQLALPLAIPAPKRVARERKTPAPSGPPAENAGGGFQRFSAVSASIAATTRKREKVDLLAAYFKELPAPELGHAAVWFTGSPFPSSRNKTLQLGWAIVRDALCEISGLSQNEFGQVYLKHSDLGETVLDILESGGRLGGAGESIESVARLFDQLHGARGPSGKLPLLAAALGRCGAAEAKFLVKILTGELRIGLKEGLVEEAVARAFAALPDQVKQVNLLVGNIGETAALAKHQQLASVTLLPFRPVKYMLASPEETAADIWKRVRDWQGPAAPDEALPNLEWPPAPAAVWIEDKYDGIRAQLHKSGGSAAIYSRDLKEITRAFGELAEAAEKLTADFIVDGEIVAMRGDAVLPYAELQRRLGRREADLFLKDEIPVRFIAFDLLWQNGENLIDHPLRERRRRLEALAPEPFQLARVTQAGSEPEIEQAFAAARARKNEGLVVKDPASVYAPGRRGLAWLKLKKALATLDCAIVGAEYGHGKRRAVLSDYTFAVRDEQSGELKTIGKAFSGLTDPEIARLTERLLKKVLWQQGRYHAVTPEIVLEIAFDLLQTSPRHSSGLAMRFPRIVRIREDKTPREIDSVATARKLAGLS